MKRIMGALRRPLFFLGNCSTLRKFPPVGGQAPLLQRLGNCDKGHKAQKKTNLC